MKEIDLTELLCDYVERIRSGKPSEFFDFDSFLPELKKVDLHSIVPLLETAALLELASREMNDAERADILSLYEPQSADELLEDLEEMKEELTRKEHQQIKSLRRPVPIPEAAKELIGSNEARFLFEELSKMNEEEREEWGRRLLKKTVERRKKRSESS